MIDAMSQTEKQNKLEFDIAAIENSADLGDSS